MRKLFVLFLVIFVFIIFVVINEPIFGEYISGVLIGVSSFVELILFALILGKGFKILK